LEDGSVVELNTNSKVRARFTPQLREIHLLRGEAVFKVAKNPNRPFRVSAGSTQIFAVGTEFNVYARQTQTVVTVIEGRVRVTDHSQETRATNLSGRDLELTVGEQAVIAPHQPIARVKLADSRQAVSWTERRLIFEDTPLSEAADEFARYNPKHIRIEDPKLRNLKVSGVFNATDPASLVEFVEAYGSVRIQAEPEGWTLY
jgi:transmembrane sensor